VQALVGFGALAVVVVIGYWLLQAGGAISQVTTLAITALVTYGIARLQARETYQRELEQKLVTDKRLLYKSFLDVAKDAFTDPSKIKPETTIPRMRQFLFGSLMNASEDVIKAYNEFSRVSQDTSRQDQTIAALGELILAMRRDIGVVDAELLPIEIMGTLVTDIDANISPFEIWEGEHAAARKRLSPSRSKAEPLG